MSLEDDPRFTLGKDPIPGDNPAGESVRYETIFDELEGMISKMDSGGPNAVPWDKVAATSTDILRDHSKDILVGAYATFALYRQESYAGLAIGLQILRDMVDSYWDGLTPPKKRERARVSAFEWIGERIGQTLETAEITQDDAPNIVAAYTALSELDDLLNAKLESQSAALGSLMRPLRELSQKAEGMLAEAAAAQEAAEAAAAAQAQEAETAAAAPATAEGAPATAPAAPPAAGAPSPTAPAPPAAGPAPSAAAPTVAASTFDSADLAKSIGELQRSLRGFAEALRRGSPADPRGYWLNRVATWLPITHLPPVEGGNTALPEIDTDTKAAIENRLKEGDDAAVLTAAENALSDAPFWLAAHRFSAAALAQLGEDYAGARAAVIGELAAFLRRFPELPGLRFSSGEPFADGPTAAWIGDEVLAGGGASGGGGEQGGWDAGLSQARQAAAKGKINDGFGILTTGRQTAPSGRARFLWDLRQAEFCLDNGEVVPAGRLLETLDDEYHELGLADWEPDIGLQVAALLLKCYATAGDRLGVADGTAAARMARLQATVCRFDMSSAVALMKP